MTRFLRWLRPFRVWHLGPDRADEWRAIRLRALSEAPEAFDSGLDEWADRPLADFAARLANGRVFAGGHRIGHPQAVAAWEADMDPDDPARAWLMSVFCAPEARGQGLAQRVIETVIADAKLAGMRSIGLHVVADNRAAIRLYRALEFADSGRQGVANSRGVAELEMLRDL